MALLSPSVLSMDCPNVVLDMPFSRLGAAFWLPSVDKGIGVRLSVCLMSSNEVCSEFTVILLSGRLGIAGSDVWARTSSLPVPSVPVETVSEKPRVGRLLVYVSSRLC